MRVVLVGGARPNFVKVAPLLRALEARNVDVVLVHTGQHYDDELSGALFRDLDIREPDHHLGVGSDTHARQTAAIMTAFEPVAASTKPDALVVVGDVNSTVACALVAAKLAIPVAHVEAGLRSNDWTMPEEINRLCTDALSDWLFTPSRDADLNLEREGIDRSRVFFVGNVMIDSLLHCRERARATAVISRLGVTRRAYTLATLHRPSSVDDAEVLERLVIALLAVSEREPVVFPLHPRTRQQLAATGLEAALAKKGSDVQMIAPVGYLEFIALLDEAHVVITDSGGVQEEATVLGVPCLTVRDNTERPTTLTDGTNLIVGADHDRILAAHAAAPPEHVEQRPELWDGHASERIAEVLTTAQPPLDLLRRGSGRSGTATAALRRRPNTESVVEHHPPRAQQKKAGPDAEIVDN